MTDQQKLDKPLLVSAFFPPDELDKMVADMKAVTLELTPEEDEIFGAVEKAYSKLVARHICRVAQLIQHFRPNLGADEITYSGTMTMIAIFEMYLRKGQEARKT